MAEGSIDWTGLRSFIRKVDDTMPLERAILFGSRARGDDIEESDYDIILVSPSFSGLSFVERISALLELWEMDQGIEVLPYTPGEFEEKSREIGVVSEAIRQGIEITLRDV